MPSQCVFLSCEDINNDTLKSIRDFGGIRYFCDHHWKLMSFILTTIRECKKCRRDLAAEMTRTLELNSIRVHGKCYRLCDHHVGVYEGSINYFDVTP